MCPTISWLGAVARQPVDISGNYCSYNSHKNVVLRFLYRVNKQHITCSLLTGDSFLELVEGSLFPPVSCFGVTVQKTLVIINNILAEAIWELW